MSFTNPVTKRTAKKRHQTLRQLITCIVPHSSVAPLDLAMEGAQPAWKIQPEKKNRVVIVKARKHIGLCVVFPRSCTLSECSLCAFFN